MIHGSTADALSMPGKRMTTPSTRSTRSVGDPLAIRWRSVGDPCCMCRIVCMCSIVLRKPAFFDQKSVGTAIRQHGGRLISDPTGEPGENLVKIQNPTLSCATCSNLQQLAATAALTYLGTGKCSGTGTWQHQYSSVVSLYFRSVPFCSVLVELLV